MISKRYRSLTGPAALAALLAMGAAQAGSVGDTLGQTRDRVGAATGSLGGGVSIDGLGGPPFVARARARALAGEFGRQDRDGNGIITRNEARSDQRLSSRFDALDRDGNGRLDAAEYGALETLDAVRAAAAGPLAGDGAANATLVCGSVYPVVARFCELDLDDSLDLSRTEVGHLDGYIENFARIDRNRSGGIELGEFQFADAIAAEGERAGLAALDTGWVSDALYVLDADHSGGLSRGEVAGNAMLVISFDALDTNQDGVLSAAEMEAGSRVL